MPDRYARVADLLERLANGESVQLGEFGDNATSTEADDIAVDCREVADALRTNEEVRAELP